MAEETTRKFKVDVAVHLRGETVVDAVDDADAREQMKHFFADATLDDVVKLFLAVTDFELDPVIGEAKEAS
jgi:hypothetical protein